MGENQASESESERRSGSLLGKRLGDNEQCGVAHPDGVYAGLEQAFHFH